MGLSWICGLKCRNLFLKENFQNFVFAPSSCSLTVMLLFPKNPVHILIPFYLSELPSQSQNKALFFCLSYRSWPPCCSSKWHGSGRENKWSDYWASFFQSVLRSTAGKKLQKTTVFKNLPQTTKFFLFFLAMLCSLWDLSSLTRNWTWDLCSESMES